MPEKDDNDPAAREMIALRTINKQLTKLNKAEIERVLRYIAEKFGYSITEKGD